MSTQSETLVPVLLPEPIDGVEIFKVQFAPANDDLVQEFELDHLLCTYASQDQLCWGEVRDWKERRGYDSGSVVATVLTCEGHSMVPHNGVYHTKEDLLRSQKTGGRLYASFKHGPRYPEPTVDDPELSAVWSLPVVETVEVSPVKIPVKTPVKSKTEDLLADDNDCP